MAKAVKTIGYLPAEARAGNERGHPRGCKDCYQ